ncbi:MAG: hypothetical protein HC800_00135 [Phormidesmis sp. RL_2_1]|nr:hypothetical protein [Phormidesmis sp. RL_2_1]
MAYVLFGAGLRVEEAAELLRSHSLSSKTQHILTLTGPAHQPGAQPMAKPMAQPMAQPMPRQVPLNRWIMGHRYGTYLKNPLTQWLKSRTDTSPYVFIEDSGEPLKFAGIIALWNAIVTDSTVTHPAMTTNNPLVTPFQARQTWCIELLMKAMSLENLSILSGLSLDELQPYAHRAKEKAALEQALAIDQKNT